MFSAAKYAHITFEVELMNGKVIHIKPTSKKNLEDIIENMNREDTEDKMNFLYSFARKLLNDNTDGYAIADEELEGWDIFTLSEFFRQYLEFITNTTKTNPN